MTDRSVWTTDRRSLETAFWNGLPFAYFLSALPIVIFLAFFRQPIGVADEWAHLARAAQLADGHLFTQVAEAGKPPLGSIDPNFKRMIKEVHSRRKEISATLLPDLERFRWSPDRALANYNSTVYFPAAYAVSILALKLGQLTDASIVGTLRMVSLCNGLLCILLTSVAIAVAPRGKGVILVVGTLPMSLFLYASASPDGALISSALLLFALLGRSCAREETSIGDFAAIAALSVVIAATKLPYLPLTIAVVAAAWLGSAPWRRPSWLVPASAAAIVAAVAVGWGVASKAGSVDVTWGAGTGDPSAQAEFLLRHPGAAALLAWRTLATSGWSYLHQMVGYLGWQDAPISTAGYRLLLAAIVVALALDGPSERFGKAQGVMLLGLLASFGAVFLSLYVAANPVGSLAPIDGVQGRYFLPLLALVAFIVPSVLRSGWARALPACVALAAIPIADLETMRTVIERYYV